MYLPSKKLTSLTFADEFVCICDSGRPEESLPISLAYQCPGCSVVPTDSRVNLLEQFSSFFFRYASHEHTRGASVIQLFTSNYHVSLATSGDVLSFGSIFWEFITQQIVEIQSSPLG